MSVICPTPLQCVAIHEIRIEIAQVNSRLGMEMEQINSKLTSLAAAIQLLNSTHNGVVSNSASNLWTNSNEPETSLGLSPKSDQYLSWPNGQIAIESEPSMIKEESYIEDVLNMITPETKPISSLNGVEYNQSNQMAHDTISASIGVVSSFSVCQPSSSSAKPKRKKKKISNDRQLIPKNYPFNQSTLSVGPSSSARKPSPQKRYHKGLLRTARIQSEPCESLRPRYCKLCQKIICNNWRSHVASVHLDEACLICNICGWQANWHLGDMKTHFKHNHPGLPLDMIDRKQELKDKIINIGRRVIEFAQASK